ncbi:PucR family transcriptional regulator [Embleya sp. NBC_00896]|uniref:PucR family transcriptional regulator n=1 Tax=Embleya sp. NBC_00896 TaxID=2975961 RepID=UPI00386776BA|nr:PucR family transcriptional regulator ligand-binding domain-containing protein [Embleya sp. NBC_00896]
MRLRALLGDGITGSGISGIRLLVGEGELDRTVRAVMTTDLHDPSRYLTAGALVLTGMGWRSGPEDSDRFVRVLTKGGATALAAGQAEIGDIPPDLVTACERHHLPLFAVEEELSFAHLTEFVVRRISAERATDLTAVVDRHRRLVQAAAGGAGLDGVLGLVAADIDIHCWVLSLTGRQAAAGGPDLPPGLRVKMARAHLGARERKARVPFRYRVDGRSFSLLPVSEAGGSVDPDAWGDWFLAVEDDVTDWPDRHQALLGELVRLVSVGRDRVEDQRRRTRRLSEDVLNLLASGADPVEVAARLRVAEEGAGGTRWQFATAALPDLPSGDAQRLARVLLEEALADQPIPALVSATGPGAVALIPCEGPGDPDGTEPDPTTRLLRERLAAFDGPTAGGVRVHIGVSARVARADGLRGALEEAWHAGRIAGTRSGRVEVVGHAELASHVALLAAVPEDVRRAFRGRLLEPLRAYDESHQADLVTTLEVFLDCDGSWTRCAARLHVHVNTLRYRIGRIEELTGRQLARLEDKVDFFLALRLR